jgi:hypothetical protein
MVSENDVSRYLDSLAARLVLVLTLVAFFGGAATQGFASAWPLDLPADAASDDATLDPIDGDADGDELSVSYQVVLGLSSGHLLTLLSFEFVHRSGRDGADRRAPLLPPPKSRPPRACDYVRSCRMNVAARGLFDSGTGGTSQPALPYPGSQQHRSGPARTTRVKKHAPATRPLPVGGHRPLDLCPDSWRETS